MQKYLRFNSSLNTSLQMIKVLGHQSQKVFRRSLLTLSTMSNMMADTRHAWWLVDIAPKYRLILSTLGSFLLLGFGSSHSSRNSTASNYGERISVMRTLRAIQRRRSHFVAGPEFGALEGHTFLIRKALYGLRSSGARWHDRLYDSLTGMGFTPCKSDPDIWMRPCNDHYEYIACYVDDLLIASKNPQGIIDALMAAPNNYKLKGTGPVNYHLGCDFFRDEDNTHVLRTEGLHRTYLPSIREYVRYQASSRIHVTFAQTMITQSSTTLNS